MPLKLGTLSNATAELGERIIETAADYIVDLIDAFAKVKIPP
jgi:creatinine amidohydrolase/Fe(II)-dependent formamide hydrolase-like protein